MNRSLQAEFEVKYLLRDVADLQARVKKLEAQP